MNIARKRHVLPAVFILAYILIMTLLALYFTYCDRGVEDFSVKMLITAAILMIVMMSFYIVYLRSQKLQHMMNDLKKANEAKSLFLSRFSHEIRTPMNAIIGMTDIARNSLDDKDKLEYCLSKIDATSDYLLALMTDILDIAKIESNKMALIEEPFKLNNFIREINSMMVIQAKDKDINFSISKNVAMTKNLIGDKIRLKQIVVNLLTNAMKFTPKNGKVKFTVNEISHDNDSVVLEFIVEDNGAGMTDEFMSRIFKPFEQSRENVPIEMNMGTGLGLAISKSLVDHMGGTIEVKSEIGVGTVFTIKVRFQLQEEVECSSGINVTSVEKAYDFTGVHILLVDDNAINVDISKTMLEYVNAEVDIAYNGQEAIDKFNNSPNNYYDLILMDIQMPVKNGLEAGREIRNGTRPDCTTVKIAAMTANAFKEDEESSFKYGMNAHIPKPVKMKALYEKLDSMLHPIVHA